MKTTILAGLHSVDGTIELLKKQNAFPLFKRWIFHSQERPCAQRTQKDQQTHSQGRFCAYFTKENRSLRRQRFQRKLHLKALDHQSSRWKKDSGDLFQKQRYPADLKPLSKKTPTILRHEPKVREQDGAEKFPQSKAENDRDNPGTSIHGWRC